MFGNDTVYIISKVAGEPDEFGNDTYLETRREITGVIIGPGTTTTTDTVGRDYITSALTFYFPAGTIIGLDDRFEWKSSQWEKDGEAIEYIHPGWFFSPWNAGVVVNAKKVEG